MDCGTRQNTNHHAHLNNDLLNFWGVTIISWVEKKHVSMKNEVENK